MLFVKGLRNGNPFYVSYEGQTEETVTSLLTALSVTDVTFITEAEYTDFITLSNR